MEYKLLSLLQLNSKISDTITQEFPETYWVIAEISQITTNRSGHCYLELIEKEAITNKIIAKTRATIWANRFGMLRSFFESKTQHRFQEGIKILVCAQINFHEIYGFSINIIDIDPTYTLGDLAQRREEIINQLKEDGVFEMNKQLVLNEVLQNIAIVSSETAAGLEDFLHQLQTNSYGYVFHTELFPATMQGEKAEESIINALDTICNSQKTFDVVVVIRGGGSRTDLLCFDDYSLGYFITQLPIPVVTGIGHERDQSIADLVAHTSLKTPTAVAEFLIKKVADFEDSLNELFAKGISRIIKVLDKDNEKLRTIQNKIIPKIKNKILSYNNEIQLFDNAINKTVQNFIEKEKRDFHYILTRLQTITEKKQMETEYKIQFLANEAKTKTKKLIEKQKNKILFAENTINLLHPERILARGYAIVLKNNKIIKSTNDVKENETVHVKMKDGIFHSQVKKVFPKKNISETDTF